MWDDTEDRASGGTAIVAAKRTRFSISIGSTAPFVGLFGTVWGIMNAFVGISQAHHTNLAVVAPGIAEALLANAIGLVAAIPAVVIYNGLARANAGYKAILSDALAEVMRHLSRDLDRQFGLVSRLQRERGCGWQPACSLWAQIYVNTLLIPATAALTCDRPRLEPRWPGLRARFCETTGIPLSFAIPGHDGRGPRKAATGGACLTRLLVDHMAPLLAGVSAIGGLSRPMLWENVGIGLAWTLEQMSALGPAGSDDAKRLVASIAGPCAAEAALEAVRRAFREGVPLRRRRCCLRYQIDGIGPCAGLCPLAQAGVSESGRSM